MPEARLVGREARVKPRGEEVSLADRIARVERQSGWWHRMELAPGVWTPGVCPHGTDPREVSERFGMPERLDGEVVMDVGAWDGLFTWEAVRRGAERVFAVLPWRDDWGHRLSHDGFVVAWGAMEERHPGMDVEVIAKSVYDVATGEHPEVDLVLFYGVLYHLKEPMRALEAIYDVLAPGGVVLVESAYAQGERSVIEVRRGHDGDKTNLFYPTRAALRDMLEVAGFERVEWVADFQGTRCTVRARKPDGEVRP